MSEAGLALADVAAAGVDAVGGVGVAAEVGGFEAFVDVFALVMKKGVEFLIISSFWKSSMVKNKTPQK